MRHVIVLVAATVGAAQAQVLYSEAFETGTGGWSVVTTLGGTFAGTRITSGGWPDAYLRTNDPDGGVSYWKAPESFRTTLAASADGAITLVSRVSSVSPLVSYPDVIATGGGLTLFHDLPQPDSTEWISHRIPLGICGSWRVGTENGPSATPEQLSQVLGACTDFRIRAEFRDGAENDDIDSIVILASTQGEPAISNFETSTEGWTTTGDAHPPTWTATGGNPGGYLRIVDVGDGRLWTYSAPAKFLCDQSHAMGGVLSFDIWTTATDYVYPPAGPDVWVKGVNGLVLGARMAVQPATAWTHYEFPLLPSAWRLGDMLGPIPTDAEFASVLLAVESLRIRGEYSSLVDTGGLDNVFLGSLTPCPADFNQDGGVDGSDISAFFEAWEAGESSADVNFDGGVDGSDIDTFFTVWEAGGC